MQIKNLNWDAMVTPLTDDQGLLRLLAKGKQAAFTALYERYQGPIYRFAWHMSGNQANAEEVTQEVFLRLIDKPGKYEPERGSLAGYLFGIARNVLRQRMEASRLDVPLDDGMLEGEEPELTEDTDLMAEFDHEEKLECLRRSILALPEPYREVVVLCEIEEMSYSEAAAVLQCPLGTVASRLNRARNMLKLKLSKMGCVR
jgi:RNA polymerase sigma-70 factor (ECF subfamily)